MQKEKAYLEGGKNEEDLIEGGDESPNKNNISLEL